MTNTIYTKVRKVDLPAISAACEKRLQEMRKSVPGVSLRMKPILKDENDDVIMLIVEVKGAGDFLPKYAGNLDIINAAAVYIAEIKAQQILEGRV